jgi:hypothetical protein
MSTATSLGKGRPPIFRFCKSETWFPVGVEDSLDLFKYRWVHATWQKYDGRSVDRINLPADMFQPALPLVVYHRIVPGGGLDWHQYWLWYLYNPWAVGGLGKHEGDWEFVQIGMTPEPYVEPILMTCSQHHNGGKREYWAVETVDNRPVVYVALGSHANYFAIGRQGGGIDLCDGEGLEMSNYEIRDFGKWACWPGRWGNSTGEGKSPESPGHQTMRWKCPHVYHSNAAG